MGPLIAFLAGKSFVSPSGGDSRVQVDYSDLVFFLESGSFSSSAVDRGCEFLSESDYAFSKQGYCLWRQRSSMESVD